jgi:hypothetical protein
METLLTFDFWSAQIAAAFEAWAILALLVLAVWGVFRVKLAKRSKELARTRKEMEGLKAYADDVDSRLESARELNSGNSDSLAQIRAQIDELRKSKPQDAKSAARLKELDESAARLALINLVTRNNLGNEAPNKERKLKLVSGSDQ